MPQDCSNAVVVQRDTDGTPLFVPDSPSSSSVHSEGTEAEEVAAYCQVRNIWTILGGNLNKPGAKQATKVWTQLACHACSEGMLLFHFKTMTMVRGMRKSLL